MEKEEIGKKALYWEVFMNGILSKSEEPAESLNFRDFE